MQRARKAEEDANAELEELIPRMEATVASLGEVEELTLEKVIEGVVQDNGHHGEFGRKIIKYQSKEKAIQDCILAIRDNTQLSVEDTSSTIRQLSKT